MSAQRVNFKATPLNSTSYETIYICNEHLDYDEHKHPIPRIGNGQMALVGPTSFEFEIPANCPFKVFPTVGTVHPGQVILIVKEYT
jgi:hypothetical protein